MFAYIENFFSSDSEINFTKDKLDKTATSKLIDYFSRQNTLPLFLPAGKYSGIVLQQSLVLIPGDRQNPQTCSYLVVGEVINKTGTTGLIHKVEGTLNINFSNKTITYNADPPNSPRVAKISKNENQNVFDEQYTIGKNFPHLNIIEPIFDPKQHKAILVMNFISGMDFDQSLDNLWEIDDLTSRLDFINEFFIAYKAQLYDIGRTHGDLLSTGNFLYDFEKNKTNFIDFEHSQIRDENSYLSDFSSFRVIINQVLQQLSDKELTQEHREKILQLCNNLRAVVPKNKEVNEAIAKLEHELPNLTRTKEVIGLITSSIYQALVNSESEYLSQSAQPRF
ncbi:hypothetical protein [Legionella bozemanae]|uniref:Uncharacterized protein n=1 Tax=Legionella bozemanae TaxID=447 RepID=A0A0W0RFD9_LEGBO|nr:hypothetical protein [Legionella bozemanae]KTC69779.1 hypothetical protein Lboz_3044 [Legionella bozemanae]STP14053.1 Uncharacterised protein [Legionella bozemanae]